ncbi:hypothetical protein DVH24_021085 [Malus domestica]|uniref:Uncharacterized protein n=1 Tax=Malus domestica TaxID=3750 RepID=A0A498JEA2_MALDO|nr:hypothetical protein DVH24_021085 [Malus domestica]
MSASLTPIYGEAAPKSLTRDLPFMGEGTCHRIKCDLYNNYRGMKNNTRYCQCGTLQSTPLRGPTSSSAHFRLRIGSDTKLSHPNPSPHHIPGSTPP